jgi:acyl-CoA synthetase (AMP-forming)/AMP-acid ligase II
LTDKLPLNTVLAAIDRKDYAFYDGLTQEHQKQLSPFLLNRYISIVKDGKPRHKGTQIEAYYLMATNEQVNTQYFELAKHPKLVWQLLCTVSPGMGTQFHQWVGHKKKDKNNSSKRRKEVERLHPHAKSDELDMLANMYTDKDLKEIAKLYGE